MKSIYHTAVLPILLLAMAAAANAQAPRTFVSVFGSDLNDCSRAAPCLTFNQAITQTSSGGEVIVLDSGSYDPVTITHSVSLIAPPGIQAGISVPAGDGVRVVASSNDVVVLRGLNITSQGGLFGIDLVAAKELHIEQCVVTGFNTGGSGIQASGYELVFIKDTVLRNNTSGVFANPPVGAGESISVDQVRFEGNSQGFVAREGVKASVRNSVASGNSLNGFGALSVTAGRTAELNVESCLIANNGQGIHADAQNGGITTVRISNSTVTDNGMGLVQIRTAVILSRLNNTLEGNTTNISGTISSYSPK